MKTYNANAATADKKWVMIDAKGLIVGRLATLVALGRRKSFFLRHQTEATS